MKKEEQYFIELLYDFVLNPNITDRERKIGLMAKNEAESRKYILAVINRVSSSLQQEAIKNGLSNDAFYFYKQLDSIITTLAPIGLNRSSILFNNSYLD